MRVTAAYCGILDSMAAPDLGALRRFSEPDCVLTNTSVIVPGTGLGDAVGAGVGVALGVALGVGVSEVKGVGVGVTSDRKVKNFVITKPVLPE